MKTSHQDNRNYCDALLTKSVILPVEHRIADSSFYSFIEKIDFWCGANCSKGYNLIIEKSEPYDVPNRIRVEFEDSDDAVFFRLSPYGEMAESF